MQQAWFLYLVVQKVWTTFRLSMCEKKLGEIYQATALQAAALAIKPNGSVKLVRQAAAKVGQQWHDQLPIQSAPLLNFLQYAA